MTSVTTPVVQMVQAVEPVAQKLPPMVQKVIEPVTAAGQPVTPDVEHVITHAPTPPVVGPTVTIVTARVSDALQRTTAPVLETLHQQPLSTIADPVLDLVDHLPVVGDAGAADVVRGAIGVLDGVVSGAADTVLPPVIGALSPAAPACPSSETSAPSGDDTWPPVSPTSLTIPDGALPPGTAQDAAVHLRAWAASLTAAQAGRAAATADAAVPPPGPIDPGSLPDLRSATVPASSSGGSGGGGAGTVATLNEAFVRPFSPWTAGIRWGDDVLPPSPSSSFDVSPD